MEHGRGSVVVLSQDKPVPALPPDLAGLSDRELIAALDSAAAGERESLHAVLKCLSEVESRGVYRDMGYRTMFDYCVLRLKMSEGAAMRRIYSARAAAKVPALYEALRSGELSLSSISRLAPHLTAENANDLIARASGARLREVETMVAELVCKEARPVPASAPSIQPQGEMPFDSPVFEPAAREGPGAAAGASSPPMEPPGAAAGASSPPMEATSAAARPAKREAGAPSEVMLQPAARRRDSVRLEAPGVLRFTFRASPAFHAKLELASRLLGRRPDGRIETVVELVLDRFLAREDPFRRKPAKQAPSKRRTRRVLRWVRDVVWRRDGGRCSYAASDGVRCEARSKLEYDHIKPWASGGASDDPANIRLLCRAHNLDLARKVFGPKVPPRKTTGLS